MIWLLVAAVAYALGIIPAGALWSRFDPFGLDDLGEATLVGFFWPVVIIMLVCCWAVGRVAAAIAWAASRGAS